MLELLLIAIGIRFGYVLAEYKHNRTNRKTLEEWKVVYLKPWLMPSEDPRNQPPN